MPDGYLIGYPLRYLVEGWIRATNARPGEYNAKVVKLNRRRHLLVELSGHWPEHEPTSNSDYQPLVH